MKKFPLHTISRPRTRGHKSIEDVPDMLLVEWSFKLFAMMNLAWDYIDTICDQCINMRISETKPLVRRIRQLKRDYDIFRQRVMTSKAERDEEGHAQRFEDSVGGDLRKLLYGLELEVAKLDLKDDHRRLVLAVQQALTMIDAVKRYARYCDDEMAKMDVWVCDYCMVQSEFLEVARLIPQFAGDCYQADIPARKLTAGILVNRIKALPLENLLEQDEILKTPNGTIQPAT